jgi:nucleotide-binding universal stress UspA family protein
MQKHFLITATEQKSSDYGINFVGHFFENKKDIKITLFYVAPRPPAVWEGERTLDSETQRQAKEGEYRRKGQKAVGEAKRTLIKSGFSEEQIRTKVQFRMLSKVDDIIQEGTQGLYDAVVLGRRGLSRLEEAFDESVSSGILKQKYDFPFWLCRVPDLHRKNVLICLDGSESAYRITDHVGFILSNEVRHRVTLLRIKRDRNDQKSDEIFNQAKKYLDKNGFPEAMVETKVIEDDNPAKAILREAEQGKYAVVAAGWSGRGKGMLERLFSGSNSYTLFRELERASLWTSY